MFVATAVCSVMLAAIMALTAAQIVTRQPDTVALLNRIEATRLAPAIVAFSAAGAAGLLVGLVIAPVGVAAASGVLAQMAAAVGMHSKARDRNLAPALIIGCLAAATLLLRATS